MEGISAGPELGTVIVGVDGSEPAHGAAPWAAGEAARRGRTLYIVHAADTDGRADYASAETIERARTAGRGIVHETLGRRGNGGYTGMRLGSVVHGLLHRAHYPVITVPAGRRT